MRQKWHTIVDRRFFGSDVLVSYSTRIELPEPTLSAPTSEKCSQILRCFHEELYHCSSYDPYIISDTLQVAFFFGYSVPVSASCSIRCRDSTLFLAKSSHLCCMATSRRGCVAVSSPANDELLRISRTSGICFSICVIRDAVLLQHNRQRSGLHGGCL